MKIIKNTKQKQQADNDQWLICFLAASDSCTKNEELTTVQRIVAVRKFEQMGSLSFEEIVIAVTIWRQWNKINRDWTIKLICFVSMIFIPSSTETEDTTLGCITVKQKN